MDCEIDRDLAQATRVVEGQSEGFGLVQIDHSTSKLTNRSKRRAKGGPAIKGLLQVVAVLGKLRQGYERLLKPRHGFVIRRPYQSLSPRLPVVRQGLGPHLTPQGMVRQQFG